MKRYGSFSPNRGSFKNNSFSGSFSSRGALALLESSTSEQEDKFGLEDPPERAITKISRSIKFDFGTELDEQKEILFFDSDRPEDVLPDAFIKALNLNAHSTCTPSKTRPVTASTPKSSTPNKPAKLALDFSLPRDLPQIARMPLLIAAERKTKSVSPTSPHFSPLRSLTNREGFLDAFPDRS